MNRDSDTAELRVRWGIVILITLIVMLGVLGPKLLLMLDGYRSMRRSLPLDLRLLVHPTMQMVLVVLGWVAVMRLHKRQPAPAPTMGLRIGWSAGLKGLAVGFACTLPMLLLGLMSDSFTPSRIAIIHSAISPGITEEIYFRAFFFGLLVQVARTPMWTTAIFTGMVFGLAHVNLSPGEGQTILGQLGPWIALIGVGGFMYAWLYFSSGWNLWLVIAMHIGMNMWWGMFSLNDTPLGVWGATASRVLCVLLALYLVVGRRVLGGPGGSTIAHEGPPTTT